MKRETEVPVRLLIPSREDRIFDLIDEYYSACNWRGLHPHPHFSHYLLSTVFFSSNC